MKKTSKNLFILISVFVSSLLTANIISSNGMIFTPFFIGSDIQLLAPGAVLSYALTFLCTDIIGQLWGKKESNLAVMCGFIGQVVCTGLIVLTPVVFGSWFESSDLYDTLSTLGWFTVGSLVAYCASQSWDVFIFHKIKDWAKNKLGEEKYDKQRWLWNNGSTMTSQIIDTVIFISIGFGLGLGFEGPALMGLMIGQYGVKFVLAALDTPFFYLLTRKRKDNVEINGQ